MRDVKNSGNPEWAKKYAQKVQKFYSGKFSEELDKAIENAING